jgi:hypothetical protein
MALTLNEEYIAIGMNTGEVSVYDTTVDEKD